MTLYLGHFAEGGGEYYLALDQISSGVVNNDITTDGASNTHTANLDVATNEADNDDTLGLGAVIDDAVVST